MDRILSWKIDSSTYAYIYPIKNSYISNRIPEDSPLWGEIINEISVWTKDTYRANFDRMASEVKSKYGQTIPWQDQYWDFSDDNTNLPVNIVLLSGGDGNGSGGYGTSDGDGIEVYEALRDAINKELEKAKKDIEEQNKRVEEFVEQKVGETIAEAKNTIAETKKELAETREQLEGKLDGAAEALDKAAALFDMGEGGINADSIKDIMTTVDAHNEWMNSYSGSVADFQTDYDLATQRLGEMTVASSVTDGLFSRFATSMNVVSNTVSNVERTMNASQGLIEDFASWYNTNASSATEASRFINAMSGQIVDSIDFISGDGLTTRLTTEMNAFSGTIKDVIMTETSSAITNVRNELNALSGIVETSVTRLNTIDGDLTTLGSRMNAEEQKMEQWMNVSDSAMSLSHDLRDTWSVESGKLSTIANLTAETDGNGNIIYYVSAVTGNEIVVSKTPEGEWVDAQGTTYADERVYVHWSQAIGSYIQQQASSITMSVMNSSGLTAAIKLAIERGESGEDESVIKMVSDRLVITGGMIAQAISANTANIGGIHMGMGRIWSEASNGDSTPKFRLDGVNGTFYANSAEIRGAITASSLTLKNGEQIETYVKGQIPKDLTSQSDVKEMISAYVDSEEFRQSIVDGYITADDLERWAATQDNLTEEQVEALIEKLAGSEVNTPLPDEPTDDGGTRHSVKIGGEVFSWVTYDADNFVVIDSELSGGTEEHPTKFMVSREGLLTAKNAFVEGKIIASEGFFKGEIEADSGYFRGSLEADSGKIGGFVIEDETLAVSGASGYTAVLKGDATSIENKDLFQLGLDLSERKILYAYKASGSTMEGRDDKIVSSDTKYSRIYLTQEQISEGEEVDAYYLNNDIIGTAINVQLNKIFSFDSAGEVVNIHPGANWWGSQHKLVKNAVKVRVQVPGGFGIGATKIRYEYYVRDATGDNDLTCLECSDYDFPIYNTRITSNGIIYCETLNAKEGMYCGTINSDGYFFGELDCNKGTLNNVSLRNTEFYGNIIMNSGSSFSSVDGKYSTRYFTILPYSVDDKTVKTYPSVEYYRYIKNSNGNNAGKIYYVGNNSGDSVSLVDIVVSSGDTITIPKIDLNIWRYIPSARNGNSGSLTLKYSLGSKSGTLSTVSLSSQSHGSTTYTGTTSEKTLTATSNTRLTIFLSYNIHLPTYYWLGADKAAASINISNTGSIKITPSGAITEGVVIGTDGFMVKSGGYGLKITDSGMKKWSNNSWVNL